MAPLPSKPIEQNCCEDPGPKYEISVIDAAYIEAKNISVCVCNANRGENLSYTENIQCVQQITITKKNQSVNSTVLSMDSV